MTAGIAGSFNLCDVRDLADGLIAAADKGKSGECYILGNEPVSFKEFTDLVSEESGCKKIRFPYRETIRDEIRWLKETGKIA